MRSLARKQSSDCASIIFFEIVTQRVRFFARLFIIISAVEFVCLTDRSLSLSACKFVSGLSSNLTSS
jgi:hypothetical protein